MPANNPLLSVPVCSTLGTSCQAVVTGQSVTIPGMYCSKIVTRFAPSPTGYLHIGGARTALFNWAFARRHRGVFILRIEDTDRVRSSVESTERILEELTWLGIDWDEGPDPARFGDGDQPDPYAAQRGTRGPYYQSQRLGIYRSYVDRLLEQRLAYKCFKTPEQLQAARQQAKKDKKPYKYDPTESLSLSPAQIAQFEAQGKPHVVRFHMPESDITVGDLVLGDVTLGAQELEDFVILKSDGYPTFHLANVVDDALMGVTHVLRGQEHLMNTPKHVALQRALGFDSPGYAHMPLIFNADGSKMSKRDKAKAARQAAKEWLAGHANDTAELAAQVGIDEQSLAAFVTKKSDDHAVVAGLASVLGVALPEIDVHDFRASGYLPEVILNYVSLLGWSPGNDVEQFGPDPLGFLKERFELDRIGKANARFDREKLRAFNTDAIVALSPQAFRAQLREHSKRFHPSFLEQLGDRFDAFADCYRERTRTLEEPFVNGAFFIQTDQEIAYDPKAIKKVLIKNENRGCGVLSSLRPLLEACGQWVVAEIEKVVENYADQSGFGMGQIAQPLRVAVTGGAVSPPIFDTLAILGRDSTLSRIDRCLRSVSQSHGSPVPNSA